MVLDTYLAKPPYSNETHSTLSKMGTVILEGMGKTALGYVVYAIEDFYTNI
jgi:hypothetical protein